MTDWISGVLAANGIEIRYARTGGSKAPLVLLHGLTGSGACWAALARALELGCDVVMPDARGHGGSSHPADGYHYDVLADDVVALIEGLGLVRPVLLGHSMGGLTAAVVAARRRTALRGVILADPTFLDPPRQLAVYQSDVVDQHRRFLRLSAEERNAEARARHRHRRAEFLEQLTSARAQTALAAWDILEPPNPDYRELIGRIDAPLLLVLADRGVVSPETGRALQALNPHLQLECIRDAGHGLPYDQPDAFERAIRIFLRSLD